jgi:CRP-like cAMP-binding protein
MKQVNAFHPVGGEAMEALAKPWKETSFKRKHLITAAGKTEKYLYLVLDGVQRAYYLHGDKEATLVFSFPPSFSGIVDSFLLQRPSIYHLETVTANRMMRIAHTEFFSVVEQYPEVATWLRVATAQVLAATLERQIELVAFNAEEKFRALLQRSPHVLNMIPNKYLASYIGIDATNFSKLLARIKI